MTRSQDCSFDAMTGLWIQFLDGAGNFSLLQNVQAGYGPYPPGLFSKGVKQMGHGAVHLLQSSAIVRNELSCIFVHHCVPSWCRLGQLCFAPYLCDTCYTLCTITVLLHLTTGPRSEKCVDRRFHLLASVLTQT